MKIATSLAIIVLSIVGIADASFITYEHFSGQPPPCTPGFNCEAVLTSKWATIGDIPISALGLFFYAAIFVFAIAHYLEVDISSLSTRFANKLKLTKLHPLRFTTTIDVLFLLSIAGLLFTVYLVSIMAFVLQAWCSYCLISATTSTFIFLISSLYILKVQPHSLIFTKSLFYSIFSAKYTYLLRPVFFMFEPETIHNFMVSMGNTAGKVPIFRKIFAILFSFSHPANKIKINTITFPNKVGLSAGFDYDGHLTQILPSVGFGFHTIGTVTLEPYQGNTPPRLTRLQKSKSLVVNKGFKSVGAKALIKKLEPLNFSIPIGISIGSTNKKFSAINEQIADIIECFALFEKSKVAHEYYELNISCPNTKGGQPFTTTQRLTKLLQALKKLKITRPVFVKMPIDLTDKETLGLVKVISEYKLAGVIIGNLTKDKKTNALHTDDKQLALAKTGGLSGKPTWERSNHLIKLVRSKYKKLTIIGTGGIFSAEDAQYKLYQGADLVQLITGMIYQGPGLIGQINNYLARNQLLNKRT